MPVSNTAINVLEGQQGQHKQFVFPGAKGGCMSGMAMLELLKDLDTKYTDRDGRPITVHGFRSCFRTWAAETTAFPHDICEASLAHTIKNKV